MTENNYDFTKRVYSLNTQSNMTDKSITRDIYDLQAVNAISEELINRGLEDCRSLSEKWDTYVTATATMDTDADELYLRFMEELLQEYTQIKGKTIYTGYDSDFEMSQRETCPLNLPSIAPAYNNCIQENDWKTAAMTTTYLPPITPDNMNDTMDMISNAMEQVKIGLSTKLVKKRTRVHRLPKIAWNRTRSDSLGE